MELVNVNDMLSLMEDESVGRTKAVEKLAGNLDVTIATLYRWINGGDHFIEIAEINNDYTTLSVFKLVKSNEIKGAA